jgi:hypothetical protein
MSTKQAARMLKTSTASIERAKNIRQHGTPELVAAVELPPTPAPSSTKSWPLPGG